MLLLCVFYHSSSIASTIPSEVECSLKNKTGTKWLKATAAIGDMPDMPQAMQQQSIMIFVECIHVQRKDQHNAR